MTDFIVTCEAIYISYHVNFVLFLEPCFGKSIDLNSCKMDVTSERYDTKVTSLDCFRNVDNKYHKLMDLQSVFPGLKTSW
jgi:hypothetical protein